MCNRSYEVVVFTFANYRNISRVKAHACTMGRLRLYNTPEEKLSAKRANDKKYYEK